MFNLCELGIVLEVLPFWWEVRRNGNTDVSYVFDCQRGTFTFVRAISRLIPIDPASGIWAFLLYASIVFIFCVLILGGILYAVEFGMRSFVRRMQVVVGMIKEDLL